MIKMIDQTVPLKMVGDSGRFSSLLPDPESLWDFYLTSRSSVGPGCSNFKSK